MYLEVANRLLSFFLFYDYNMLSKVPKGAESCVILAATVEFVSAPVIIWMRLQNTIVMHDTCELGDVTPTRFIGMIIRPLGEKAKAKELGKIMGTLMSDQVYTLIGCI